MYLNKAIVIGNLTRDPEMKSLPSGIRVATFSLATNRVWKDKNGAKQESADYHNIVVFSKTAELVGQYLKRGQSALVEGRMQTRSWDDASGVKKYRTEIVADRVQFGPKAGGAAFAGGSAPSAAPTSAQGAEGPHDDGGSIEYPSDEINPEDIPF
jgi:single-strand DNA-binding protein